MGADWNIIWAVKIQDYLSTNGFSLAIGSQPFWSTFDNTLEKALKPRVSCAFRNVFFFCSPLKQN